MKNIFIRIQCERLKDYKKKSLLPQSNSQTKYSVFSQDQNQIDERESENEEDEMQNVKMI